MFPLDSSSRERLASVGRINVSRLKWQVSQIARAAARSFWPNRSCYGPTDVLAIRISSISNWPQVPS